MLTKYYEASSIATAKAARIQCAFDRFFATTTTTTMPDKAMKRMEGSEDGEKEKQKEKELLLSLALVAWEAASSAIMSGGPALLLVINQVPKLQTAVKRGRGWGEKGQGEQGASGDGSSETVMSSGSQTRERESERAWEREATAGNELEKEPSAVSPRSISTGCIYKYDSYIHMSVCSISHLHSCISPTVSVSVSI